MQQSQIHFFQLMRFRDFEAGRRQKSVETNRKRPHRPGSTKIKHMLRPNR
jgi:hypothetical protein